MFRPRHAYRSPITSRYKGKAKGCPVFNNLIEINSNMVEQHDECLECLAKIKNRTDLYKTLADNNKPNNNVIKSLQRLSSSASNNRLKTCLQFLIIKVNEKSIPAPRPTSAMSSTTTTTTTTRTSISGTSPKQSIQNDLKDATSDHYSDHHHHSASPIGCTQPVLQTATRNLSKRQKSQIQPKQSFQKPKQNQLASPPQDQVSSTQDQLELASQDDHDCQTSPMMLITDHYDETQQPNESKTTTTVDDDDDDDEANDDDDNDDNRVDKGKADEDEEEEEEEDDDTAADSLYIKSKGEQPPPKTHFNHIEVQTQSSPPTSNHLSSNPTSTSTTSTATETKTTIGTSPKYVTDFMVDGRMTALTCEIGNTNKRRFAISDSHTNDNNHEHSLKAAILTTKTSTSHPASTTTTMTTNAVMGAKLAGPTTKRRRTQNSMTSDQETSSIASWSSTSYSGGAQSPPSPMSPASSISSTASNSSTTSSASSSSGSSSASCIPSMPPSPSPSPLSSPDIIYELKGPRLKLSEDKIRKIKKRPVMFDDLLYLSSIDQPSSFASTPSAANGFSPGQHSNTTQNSDQTSSSSSGLSGLSMYNMASHMFQAPPSFINNLKPYNLQVLKQEPTQTTNPPPVVAKVEMLNCAICGIKDKPPKISRVHGQNSCLLCTKFFANFLKRPQQLYCSSDGDCLMTFDRRCEACWIKICLQKFKIDEEHRKTGYKYSPKLRSSPNVSLITIDTSTSR